MSATDSAVRTDSPADSASPPPAAADRGGPSPMQYPSDEDIPPLEEHNLSDARSWYDDEPSADEIDVYTNAMATARSGSRNSAPAPTTARSFSTAVPRESPPPLDDDGFPVYNPADFEQPIEREKDDAGGYSDDDYSTEEKEPFTAGGKLYDDDYDEGSEYDVDYTNPQNARVEFIGKQQFVINPNRHVDDSFLESDEPGAISRLVVIDAANILHGLTPFKDGATIPTMDDQKVDAAYILSLVYFFVRKGIECMVVTQHKYMLDNVTENMFIMRKLQELGMLMVMDKTYDDLVLFAVAAEFDAVILTEDQFKSERQTAEFMQSKNSRHALQLRVSPIYPRISGDFLPREEWGSVTSNGHFVVDHLLQFDGPTEVKRRKFFSTPARGGHRYELVEEKYRTWVHRKEQVKEELEALVARIQPLMSKMREKVVVLHPRGQ